MFFFFTSVFSQKEPQVRDIEAITIVDKSDPRALEILRKVDHLFKSNSPQSLESYTYKSYEKVSLDIDEDSISALLCHVHNINMIVPEKSDLVRIQ